MPTNHTLGARQRTELASQDIRNLKTNQQRLEHLASYGMLAPSTHNTQPWKVELKTNKISLYADFTKNIPEADPDNRDLFLSQGTFIENVALACDAYNLKHTIKLFPKAPGSLIATITISNLASLKAPKKPTLLQAIRIRQNFRGFFAGDVDPLKLKAVTKAASNTQAAIVPFTDLKTRNKLASLTVAGLKAAYARPEFRTEISTYINHNLSSKRTGLHGYSLRLNLPMSFIVPQVMKRKDIGAKLAALNKKTFDSASGVIIIASKETNQGWIEAGRVLERTMVLFAEQGIRSSIYAAAIETPELRPKVNKILAKKGMQPQLLLCIGPAPDALPFSVRLELSEIIL